MRECRFSYLSGACANRHVESLECLGEDKCEFSGLNILSKVRRTEGPGECGADRWLGLYCERYRRFYCPGKDNCASRDTYMRHFERHIAQAPRRPEEE